MVWEKARPGSIDFMTSSDYYMTMDTVGIAELKAKLSQYLRSVRQGHPVTVMDRERPIATIIPYAQHEVLRVRKPDTDAPALQDVPLPPPFDPGVDIVDVLLAERQTDR